MATLDISLLVFAVNIDGGAYELGDIVSIEARSFNGCKSPRFVKVHVEGIPLPAPADQVLKRLKVMLESQILSQTFNDEVRRRAWRVKVGLIPNGARNTLLTDRELTVSWGVAKNYIGKRVVTDESDRSTDSDLMITDGDV